MSFRYPRKTGEDVVILGAGFSKAISGEMPLLNELSETARRRLAESGDQSPIPFIDGTGQTVNVELAMTYLSQRHPWLSEADYLRNRSRSLKIVEAIGDEIEERVTRVLGQSPPDWLHHFVSWLHYRRAVVITLNYDTLLERAFSSIEIGRQGTDCRYYVTPQTLYPVTFRVGPGELAPTPGPTAEILKLHGSTNWLYSGRNSFFGEAIMLRATNGWRRDARTHHETLNGRVPLLVPPVSDKVGYFENEDIRHVWMRAAASLKAAQRILCFGYSLPDTDLTMRFLLQSDDPGRKVDFILVNTDPKVVRHYRSLLPSWFNIIEDYVGEHGPRSFGEALFSDRLPVTRSGPVRKPQIEGAVRKHLQTGMVLNVDGSSEDFQIGEIDADGVTALIGLPRVPVPIAWEALADVLYALGPPEYGRDHGGNLTLDGWEYRDDSQEPTVHRVMSRWINRFSAVYVAKILKAANLADLNAINQNHTLKFIRPYVPSADV